MKVNSSMPRGSAPIAQRAKALLLRDEHPPDVLKSPRDPAAFGLPFVPSTASAVALTSEGDAIKGFTSYNYTIK